MPRPSPDGLSTESPQAGASLALGVLVGLVVLSPWPFGSVHAATTRAIALVALATTLVALAWAWVAERRVTLPLSRGLVPIALAALGLWLLAGVQVMPIPHGLHAFLAPASASVWHPAEPAAAAVLGPGPHPVSVHPAATARWMAFFAAIVGLSLASVPALQGRRSMLRVSITIVGSALVIALYAFVARLWLGDRLFGRYESLVRPFGPFVSKNHFAGYVEMAALLAVGLATGLAAERRDRTGALSWIEGSRASRVVVAWAAAAILVLAVPVSLSRGGVVSLVAGLVVFALLRAASGRAEPRRGGDPSGAPRRRLALSLAAGAGAIALALAAIAFVLPESARARVGTIARGGGDGSSSYRLGLWRDTLRLAASSPYVGSGLGAYADAITRFKTGAGDVRVEHAESDVLEVVADSGLLGLSASAAALLLVFRLGWRRLQRDPHRLSRALRTGALAAVAALAVHSFFDFNLRIPSNALLAALVAAVAVSPPSPREDEAHTSRGRSAPPLALAAVAAASLAIAFAVPRTDARSFADGLSLRTGRLRLSTAERDVVDHLRHRPADAEAWLVLAWLRLPSAPRDAEALANLSVRTDPGDERLATAARRITAR